MPNTLPTPVAAALGLVPTAIDSAKRVPSKVVQLPVLAISTALSKWAEAQQRYDELAERGERFVSSVRNHAPESADVQEWLTERIPTETASDAVAQVTELLDKAASRGGSAVPAEEAPKGEPTPSAPAGSPDRHDTAATPEVVAVVEEVAAALPVETPSHDELPLPDYDHMTLGSLRGRLRSLTLDELVAVREYEKAHADRLPVVTLVDNRIAKLSLEGGEPSPGGQLPVTPEPAGKGKVTGPEQTPAKRPTKKVRTT
ncbi:MAG: hypothetical protein QOD70_886 [Frankiales bacterium]|nr:hypothetical protein [Frankiales bacterium]